MNKKFVDNSGNEISQEDVQNTLSFILSTWNCEKETGAEWYVRMFGCTPDECSCNPRAKKVSGKYIIYHEKGCDSLNLHGNARGKAEELSR